MNPTDITPWLTMILAGLSIAGTIYTIMSRPGKQAQDGVDKLAGKVEDLEDRVSKCEADIQHLPDKDATHRLEIGMAELNGQIKVLSERLHPVAAITQRMQELMLEGRK